MTEEYSHLQRIGLSGVIDAYPDSRFFIHWDCLEALEDSDPSPTDYSFEKTLKRYAAFCQIIWPLLWHPRCYVCCSGSSAVFSVTNFERAMRDDLSRQMIFIQLPTLCVREIASVVQITSFANGNTIQKEFLWDDKDLDDVAQKLKEITLGIPRIVRTSLIYLFYKKTTCPVFHVQECLESMKGVLIRGQRIPLELVRCHPAWCKIYGYLIAMFLLGVPFSYRDEVDLDGVKVPIWFLASKAHIPLQSRTPMENGNEISWLPTFSRWSVEQFIRMAKSADLGMNLTFLGALFSETSTASDATSSEVFFKTVIKYHMENSAEKRWDSMFYFLHDTVLHGASLSEATSTSTNLVQIAQGVTVCFSFRAMRDEIGVNFLNLEISRFRGLLDGQSGILVIFSTGLLCKDLKAYFPEDDEFARLEPGKYDLQKGRLVRKRKVACLFDVPEDISVFILFRPGLVKVIGEPEVVLLEHLMRNPGSVMWQACFEFFLVQEKGHQGSQLATPEEIPTCVLDISVKHINVVLKESGKVLLRHFGISANTKFKHLVGDLNLSDTAGFSYLWQVKQSTYSQSVNAFDIVEDDETIFLSLQPKLDTLDYWSTVAEKF
ncbi:hypothetical protein K493DRAFT_311738 [Basidiobolus meristosporus CBS 931.73]|uniref:Uncharacterized protein n=1 Tax=Basidiobolus meristosporus CBS 931.73 TaxID=1314790 RepID=A0A1Y1YZT0_9FUNG|nr:hypothetical protein K493DRAFT_311738 [Basidiobolus meristosporus CBS 931.73]|eukprot:ORY03374.1 hypothetical protein K493DRAFT_311738 [Basidiobolus meristosporus CBS 931.73]